ncbi:trichohyalin [Takifugu flavidus]|uniref:trichohyalin n=1 Tax=Takifugu flavidus TaxID=433684 RepID=UPI002544085E|nr:trichohyalin [Takifugu flavidus]
MSLRVKSHTDLQTAGKTSLDEGLCKSLSVSSSNISRGARFGNGTSVEVKGLSTTLRRPVRAVRPVSTITSSGSFLQINHLQGELVRKRKECEDLRRENKFLANEIHMERIAMRTENELTMRNLRNLNQELQAQVRELKQRLHQSLQRATLCSQAAEEADRSRGEAEKGRALAEARALGCQRDKEVAEADRSRTREEVTQLKKELTDVQLSLAQTQKSYFETKLALERVAAENQALLQEKEKLQREREELGKQLRRTTEEKQQVEDSELNLRRRATALEEESKKANEAQREAEAERRLTERERRERAEECLSWREKHRELAEKIQAEEDVKALRKNKTCQANIKTYFLCMTESDQRVKILKNPDGTTRNFTEGEPVFFAPEPSTQEPERSSSRTMLRVSAPHLGGTRARVTSTICPPLGANVLKLAPSAGTGRWWNIFGSLLTTTKIPSSQMFPLNKLPSFQSSASLC